MQQQELSAALPMVLAVFPLTGAAVGTLGALSAAFRAAGLPLECGLVRLQTEA